MFTSISFRMQKKILSLLVSIIFFTQSTFALTLLEITNNAILLTKNEPNYGKFTIDLPSWFTSSIQFLPFELEWFEREFLLVVNNTYNTTLTWSSWFIQQMNAINSNWLITYTNNAVAAKDRAKAKLWSNIYTNFLKVRNNSITIIPTTNQWTTNQWTTTSNNNRTYSSVANYTASNWKSYTIRQSNDWYYRYRQWAWKFFRSMESCINYVEVQNRITYTAPNQRRYGIFRFNNRYYFNRDEWSISLLSWITIDDTIAYINQHNQSTNICSKVKERKCY